MEPSEDDIGSLERARQRLYHPGATTQDPHVALAAEGDRTLPHAWDDLVPTPVEHQGRRHVRIATMFFTSAAAFFVVALLVAGYFLYFGGNSISVDKITIDVQGPTTIAGGDTVPLLFSITNRNPSTIEDATFAVVFPEGTRDPADVLKPLPRYEENLGSLASGATVTRAVKAVIFGEAGQTVILPISFSYGTGRSNSTFQKKASYPLAISSTPLSVSIDTLAETVSGKPLTLTVTVRSNAQVPLANVVLDASLPFGFSVISSSVPLAGSGFLLGTIAPGASKVVRLVGTFSGQQGEERTFHFTVGTAQSPTDQAIAVTYMKQSATVALTAPFINTSLSLNGDTSPSVTVAPGTLQNVSVSYVNTLPTPVTNARVTVTLSGSAIDYDSIRPSTGFYDSTTRSIVFSPDTDPGLSALAPGATGVGAFTFQTLPTGAPSPSITFTTSVSGTRVGETNVPEQVTNSTSKTVKVATVTTLAARTLHGSGPFPSAGPVPPVAEQATTYTVEWSVRNGGSAVAGGAVTAALPSYVTYTGKTSGMGSFSYSEATRTVSWNTGDLSQGASAIGYFQISITPSTSQKGNAPLLTSVPGFKGFDRFAGIDVSASGNAATTNLSEPGAVSGSGTVQ